ncbi:MAG: tRNA glutamyl-Q(34) synthetase GluQRS [Alphaproteobacteria bacterium]
MSLSAPINKPVNTRFAPSPTGLLHLGHAVAAITAQDIAAQTGGRFFLRIDDIDASRRRPEFEAAIYEDLRWLGLNWREPVRRQSDSLAQYQTALDRLQDMGLIYPCFCTRKEILLEAAQSQDAPHGNEGPRYPGTCRELGEYETNARLQTGKAVALRLDVGKALAQTGAALEFNEHGSGPGGETGKIIARPDLAGDIVLARRGVNGVDDASYHLAVAVDDAAQNINCVTRGRDLFLATHIQRLLQALLNYPVPEYLHHELAVDGAGKRLAKRHDALSLRHFREQGITPAQVRAMAREVTG